MKKFHSLWAIFSTASLVCTTIISYAQSQENVDTQSPGQVSKESDTSTLKEVKVIHNTPLPGTGIEIDKVPANVQTVTGRDIQESGSLNLSDYMNKNLTGVHVNDNQGNPYQMDLNYRGFTASPLLGTPQGISIYMDGVRLNQAFGDIVQWDLIPKSAN